MILGSVGADSLDKRKLPAQQQGMIESDPAFAANVLKPRERTLRVFDETLDRMHLDGYVYPATQMPPPDETMPQNGEISGGPHSETSWVNIIGVPAIVVVGWILSRADCRLAWRSQRAAGMMAICLVGHLRYEQATHYRHPPVLVESGLLPDAR